jgi:uncharacterized protein with GYD domain
MVKALILVSIEPNETAQVFDDIKGMAHITEALQTYGEYDAAFVIETEHVGGIQDFVKAVRKIKGITRTITLIEVA